MTVGGRLIVHNVLSVILVSAVTGGVAYWVVDQAAKEDTRASVRVASTSFDHEFEANRKQLENLAFAFGRREDVIASIEGNNMQALTAKTREFAETTGLAVLTVVDKAGTVLARGHSDKTGDSVASQAAVQKALRGIASSGMEEGTVVKYSLRAGYPLKNGNDIVGAVTVGLDIASEGYVDAFKQEHKVDVTIFQNDKRIMTTIVHNGTRAIGTVLGNSVITNAVLERGNRFESTNDILGEVYYTEYWPIRDASGAITGMFFVGQPVHPIQTQLLIPLTISFALTCGLAALAASFVGRRIGARMKMLTVKAAALVDMSKEGTRAAAAVASGDLTVEVKGHVIRSDEPKGESAKDEIGALSSAFESLQTAQIELEAAVRTMVSQLRSAFGELIQIGGEVGSGAAQVSDASRQLSEGTTEQAASLEEITSAMSDVTAQTRTSAESASSAQGLADSASSLADVGSQKVSSMAVAMKDIEQSSNRVVKIVKAIDDVAFQTNLLALNAAVEAARAGVHGKGFAVVAEEVRSLAGRSAKAAQETTTGIQESVNNIRNGVVAAAETGESLEAMRSAIRRVRGLVVEIATACAAQSSAASEISTGLQQIDRVTQLASANAEETASAAAELNSQVKRLQGVVARFRLTK